MPNFPAGQIPLEIRIAMMVVDTEPIVSEIPTGLEATVVAGIEQIPLEIRTGLEITVVAGTAPIVSEIPTGLAATVVADSGLIASEIPMEQDQIQELRAARIRSVIPIAISDLCSEVVSLPFGRSLTRGGR